jgi:squalene-associated FAD-dependent desaturase
MKPVVVVGGGWAGLAAAIELARHHIPVKIIEAARQLGGRARTVQINGYRIDNGQHLMLGAYREMLRLLRIIGVSEATVFERLPLELWMTSKTRPDIRIKFPALSAPLHLAAGLHQATGLTLGEKLMLVRLCATLLLNRLPVTQDISIEKWLECHGQPASLKHVLWEPLCLASMNTPLHQASTQLFLRVIREVFNGKSRDSDLLLPRVDLGTIFPEPAERFITSRSGTIQSGCRVTGLRVSDDFVAGVAAGNELIDSDHVILAVPAPACARLITPYDMLRPVSEALTRMTEAPICTVYIQYPPKTRLAGPLLGMLDTTAQWVFDRGRNGQPGLMAVVISGAGPHMDLDKEDLAQTVIGELARRFPAWPAPLEWYVIREKQATFVACAGIDILRPSNQTALTGCWLAGDYTATGYPATLEGAVHSGRAAAAGVMKALGISVIRNGA